MPAKCFVPGCKNVQINRISGTTFQSSRAMSICKTGGSNRLNHLPLLSASKNFTLVRNDVYVKVPALRTNDQSRQVYGIHFKVAQHSHQKSHLVEPPLRLPLKKTRPEGRRTDKRQKGEEFCCSPLRRQPVGLCQGTDKGVNVPNSNGTKVLIARNEDLNVKKTLGEKRNRPVQPCPEPARKHSLPGRTSSESMARILIIEPFYGGSHKQLLDTILEGINQIDYEVFSLPAKKWHWRARTSALYFSQTIPTEHQYNILFTSSVLNLAELLGVRPDLAKCKKIVYFHENQLVYPVRDVKERDCQYGLNQIMTCLSADELIFNSNFNRTSFLNNIVPFLNIQSDFKLKHIRDKIEPKCEVLYFPIKFHRMPKRVHDENLPTDTLHLIWPHRWEHDKNPQLLTEVLLELNKRQVDFKATICGETFQTVPECFEGIRDKLGPKLINFGYLSRDEYVKALMTGDIVISTAGHEFYGVSMLEATYCGCMPIAPNKLVYPEIYPPENLYNTSNQLIKMLYNWCRNPGLFRKHREKFFEFFAFERYSAQFLVPKYLEKFKMP